jgi:dCMP deaminase
MDRKKIPHRLVPNRDEKYMGLAWMVAGFSKDPKTQMGAFLVTKDNFPLSFGYNGPPSNIDDNAITWERPYKNDFIIHAEENAIKHAKCDLSDSVMYITGLPCKHCVVRLIGEKISEVVYLKRRYDAASMQSQVEDIKLVHEIARLGNLTLREFKGTLGWMEDHTQLLKSIWPS